MRRRRLLASAGTVLLAGCLGAPPPGSDPGTTTTAGVTTETTTGAHSSRTDPGVLAVSDFDVSTAKVAPEKRYYVRVVASYSGAAVEREDGEQTVRDVSELDDPDLRAAVEDALSAGKVYRDEIPGGLRELVEEVDFFTWEARADSGDTYTHFGVAVYRTYPDRDPVLEFDAEVVDDTVAPGDPGSVVFSLTNVGDSTQEVFSGTVPPFSVLWADGPGRRALLWREYVEEGCVTFGEMDGEAVMYQCDIGVTTPLEPAETVEKRYELHRAFEREAIAGNGFDAPGQYTVSETLTYSRMDADYGPATEVDWTVAFELEAV